MPSAVTRVKDPKTISNPTAALESNSSLWRLLGHELGSPLTYIVASLRLWQERGQGVDHDELQLVLDQALTLKARLEDLLLLDQLVTGTWRPIFERVRPSELVRRVIEKQRAAFHERRLHVRLDDLSDDPIVADREMLERAVEHLLTNACKFSRPGETVQVRVDRAAKVCRISVTDRGIGIPVEEQAQIFQPFYQVDLSRARRYGGMGIGLKLVRAIIEQHGGTVQVLSTKGEGSTFSLHLPEEGAPLPGAA
jgi:signal transduction histidine kinase